jgi:cytochrome P450
MVNPQPNCNKTKSVFTETLRLHPVLGFFNRICDKPYKVPGTDVVLDKDTPVIIPILGLQRDPEYFPDPLEFNPERFNEDQAQVPFTFLPFGEGPRFCIGINVRFELSNGIYLICLKVCVTENSKPN